MSSQLFGIDPRARRLLAVPVLLAGALSVATPRAALAETPSALIVSTAYPSVSVQPGADVTFDLAVGAPFTQPATLALAGVPQGWEVTMRGGGMIVSGVTATPERTNSVSLEVKVPADAKAGDYRITVHGTGQSGTSDLPLAVKVDQAAASAVEITSDFPQLKGKPTDTFTYTVTIRNNTPEKQVFNFDPSGPQGWDVNASPSSEAQASTLSIDAGATGTVQLTAKPPANVKAGSYPLTLKVTNKAGQSASGAFQAVVGGTTSLKLAMSDDRVSFGVRAGGTSTRTMVITNDGSAPLTGVTLSASPPSDWNVVFTPQSIAEVAPGDTATVKLAVRPAKGALSGDYVMSTTASAGTASTSADLRVTVKQSQWWGLLGAGLIAGAIAVLWAVYRRFGRR
jgi:uncharacterized membrane protein